jgi:alkylresorcinol/alkylpyrone synthase
MPDARILGIGRSVPANRYTQEQLYQHSPWERSPLIDRLFLDSPIASRALFVPPEWYATPRTLTDTNRAWKDGAMLLAGQALRDALARTGTAPHDLDLVAVTSVTGYATPGLDLLLVRQEGLRHDLARAHFNCIGCHAAVPLLKVAADHAARRPGSRAVALAVEICSACFANDDDPQNLVALALFADGAAAAIVSTEGSGPRLVDFGALYDIDALDTLGFGLTTGGFRIVLDPSIPHRIAAGIGHAVDQLLTRNGVRPDQISTWCFHPGGSRILDEVQRTLGLDDPAMLASRRVLRAYGNMSSPSILFVLAEAMRAGAGAPGTYGLLAAFGPGLGIETALLAFD